MPTAMVVGEGGQVGEAGADAGGGESGGNVGGTPGPPNLGGTVGASQVLYPESNTGLEYGGDGSATA